MRTPSGRYVFLLLMPLLFFSLLWVVKPGESSAYDRYSQNRDATNCRACHGDFRAAGYVSHSDGVDWGTSLHDGHRITMLNGDCDVCHGSGPLFPVNLRSSAGGIGLDPISCSGCHGRAEDEAASGAGYAAGLRQHHSRAGVFICVDCHDDADPMLYAPVGEDILPPYYSASDPSHPNMPASSCNEEGSETFFGATGLDNDGDLFYDGDDSDCSVGSVAPSNAGRLPAIESQPNPFSPVTEVSYTLPDAGWAKVEVFSSDGSLVRTLADGMHEVAGTYRLRWDGTDGNGRSVPNGVYFLALRTESGARIARTLLLR